ncbi:MAG TPA: anthranilate phosphoribosyltransferase [Limnobacter sp.]|uniref:anthranilate phosphoribosyltransferase n=1 Tax=Limnobacter sp. TaxID=2003368 RepID=UPI002EDB7F80
MSETFSFSATLNQLLAGHDLDYATTRQAFEQLLNGGLTPVQVAGLLVALRVKGETVDEVAAAAQVMRDLVTPVVLPADSPVVDLCGTGGDGAQTFNISTASMFVLASAGGQVAKHGGRSVSSNSGSADVLELLGVNINLKPEQVAQCIQSVGIGFMFAPNHHSAMRFAGPVRKELGVRTVFNILGPLTNPALAKRQVMGVYSANLLDLQAQVLARLGSVRALIVHGNNGMDELCIECDSQVAELNNGVVNRYTVRPEDFGLQRASHDALKARSVEESRDKIFHALEGKGGAVGDIVLLNGAAGLYTAGLVNSLQEGVELARQQVASGAALRKLREFVEFTQLVSR